MTTGWPGYSDSKSGIPRRCSRDSAIGKWRHEGPPCGCTRRAVPATGGRTPLQKIVRRQPIDPSEIDSITVSFPAFLTEMMPYHDPKTGLEGKYSIEYDLAAIALDGRAGMYQYTDEAVQRPEAREIMSRVSSIPVDGDIGNVKLESRVELTLKSGEAFDETVTLSHGRPEDPLTDDELLGKFHECAEALVPLKEREQIIDLCWRLDALDDVSELAEAVGAATTVR